jgi:hypothetical protein
MYPGGFYGPEQSHRPGQNADINAVLAAQAAYRRVRRKARRLMLWARLRRKSRRLFDLGEALNSVNRNLNRKLGVLYVPITSIRGSEGRCEDFDIDFYPLRPHIRERWLSVAAARGMNRSLPPVELCLILGIYYVRDGHHRVSVARAFGQKEIEAEVLCFGEEALSYIQGN